MTYFGITLPWVVYVIFYVAMIAAVLGFLVVVSRKKAPSARREPFRKPALVRAAGLLLFAIAALLVLTMDGGSTRTPPHWALALQGILFFAGILLAILGGRAYLRAGDKYPAGKHADLNSPPDRH